MLSAKSFASPLPIPDVAPIIIAFFILNFVCLLCRPTMRHNVSRAGDRNPVLRLRQGYGACTLLSLRCSFSSAGLSVVLVVRLDRHTLCQALEGAAWRSGGFLVQKFNRRTALEPTIKLSYKAQNPLLRQTAVMRSPFLARACSCVHCLVDVPWLGGSFVVFVWLCAFGKTANVPPNALAYSVFINRPTCSAIFRM